MKKTKKPKIWNKDAINYNDGVKIYDNITKNYYSEKEAREQKPEIKNRLILKPNKIGTWVEMIYLKQLKKWV